MANHDKGQSGNRYNFLIVFIVALGSFTYGYNNAIIGSIFGLPGFFTVSRFPMLLTLINLSVFSTTHQSRLA